MKISCQRCRADYDIEDAKIPASGFRMTCPACSNEIVVPKGASSAAAAPASSGPREIELSFFEEEPPAAATSGAATSEAAVHAATPEPPSFALADEIDFSTVGAGAELPHPPAASSPPLTLELDPPVRAAVAQRPPAPPISAPAPMAKPSSAPQGSRPMARPASASAVSAPPVSARPPSPVVSHAPISASEPELPAPVRPGAVLSSGRPVASEKKEEPDLPAPRSASAAPPPLPAGMKRPASPGGAPPLPLTKPSAPGADEIDLPAPRGVADLPAPRGARPPSPPVVDLPTPKGVMDLPTPKGVMDLPTPKGVAELPMPMGGADLPKPHVGVDLPRPADGAPRSLAPSQPPLEDLGITLDLDSPDADDAPPAAADELQPRAHGLSDLPTPRETGLSDLPTPREGGLGDVPTPATSSSGEHAAEFSRGASATPLAIAPTVDSPSAEDSPSTSRNRKLLYAGVGLALAVAVGGGVVALGLLGTGTRKHPELDAKLASARRALAEDTLTAFRRAATELKPLSMGEKPSEEAALLEAQAHLLQAQLGVIAELAPAKSLLERPSQIASSAPPLADRSRADGLRALVTGDLVGARKQLKDLLGKTPLDASVLAYLGWTELEGRDLVASEAAFARAVSVEATRAQALYGLGLAKERLGDAKAAADAYRKALVASPEHFRARLGQLRLAALAGDGAAASKLEILVASKASALAPRELAEAHVTSGQMSLAMGRANEAEDRFRKAVAIDGNIATSHVAWDARLGLSRARLLSGRSAEAIEDLRKQVALDLRGIEPRLLLAEALIEQQETKEVDGLLGVVRGLQPKEPRLALLRGRLLTARATVMKEDREQAVTLFREATIADPSLLAAWAALSRTLFELGHTQEALDVLGKAAEALSGDPRGAAVLGSAYLAIGKATDAEVRFRAVLAASDGKGGVEQLPVWVGLGEALEAQSKLTEAQATYAEALKLAPKSSMLLEKQAQLAMRAGKLEQARGFLEDAMKLGQPSSALRVAAAELAFKTGHADDARQLAESVLKEDERSAPASLLLARVELEAGHADDALGLARRATLLQNLPEAHLLLAQLLERTGKLDAAASEYDVARRPPTNEQASLGRVRIMVRKGATQEALVELVPLAKIAALRGEVLVLEGDCYTDLQQADKARRAYEEASKVAPQMPDAAFKLGRAMLDSGHRQPGVVALERAVRIAPAQTSWLAEAHLLLGDAHRLAHENEAAVRDYGKYLELAPPSAPMRTEAQRQVRLLGGGK